MVFLSLAGLLGPLWWPFKIADFFRLQYAVLSFILALASFYFGQYETAVVAIGLVVLNLFNIRHYLFKTRKAFDADGAKILSVNAFRDNFEPDNLEKYLFEEKPDLLLIMEMTDKLNDHLTEALKDYEFRLETPVRDGFRIALLSKSEMKNAQITHHGPNDTPLLYAQINLKGKEYDVYSAHPKPALNQEYAKEREIYFQDIEEIFKENKHPCLLLGDFNSVPWERHFVKFLRKTKLQSTLYRNGYTLTWPVFMPLMGIPMDHIIVCDQVKFSKFHRGPFVGSDHFPLVLTLSNT